jgi:hypothetical protein
MAAWGFCVSARLMADPPAYGQYNIKGDQLTSTDRSQLYEIISSPPSSLAPPPAWRRWRAQTYAMVGIFYTELCEAIQQGQIGDFLADPHPVCQMPPSAEAIPLVDLEDLPELFSPTAVTSFGASHRSKIVASHLFKEGDLWMGYYCYENEEFASRFGSRMVFDPAMRDITLQIITNTSDPPGADLTLVGRGYDNIDQFDLSGKINRDDGAITLLKQYRNGSSWTWHATLTPFGIVGAWGSGRSGGEGWGGYFWLWKKRWANNDC